MKSDVETLSPTRVKLTVEVPFDELKPSMDDAYRTIGSQVSVPGFRKGKIPPRIIDQRVGRAAVLQEAVNNALPTFYGRAATENELRPLGQPEVDVTEVPDGDSGDLKFTVEVDVRPDVQLPDYSSLSVSIDDVEVTDEDVAARLDTLRERFGTLVGVDRAVVTGDFVSLDLTATIGEDVIDTAKGISYEVGSGNLLPGLDDAVVGASAEQTVTFTAALAGGERAGEDAKITVVVQSVKERQLPDADDDFAGLASEFDTLEELQADLRTQVEQSKRFEQGVVARDRVLDALLAAVEVPVPQGLVDAEVHSHLENESRLEDDAHRAEVAESTVKALQTQFVLDAVVEAEDVQVTQEEFVEYVVTQAPRFGMDPNAFAQALSEAGQVQATVAEVARRKGLAIVLEQATITDPAGNPVNLDDLVPPPPGGRDEPTEDALATDGAGSGEPTTDGAGEDDQSPEPTSTDEHDVASHAVPAADDPTRI